MLVPIITEIRASQLPIDPTRTTTQRLKLKEIQKKFRGKTELHVHKLLLYSHTLQSIKIKSVNFRFFMQLIFKGILILYLNKSPAISYLFPMYKHTYRLKLFLKKLVTLVPRGVRHYLSPICIM